MCRAAGIIGAFAVVIGMPLSAAGQQQDTTRSRIDIIRERLRASQSVIRDSAQIAADSVAADSAAQAAARRRPPPAPLPRDSIMTQLLTLEGFIVTEYKADSAAFDSDSSRLGLRRSAQVVREGQTIVADTSIYFDQLTSIACAYGTPTVTGAGAEAPLRADSLCYNIDLKRGQAYQVVTEITEGANWIVHSDESFMVGETLYSHGGVFTDCNLEEPHYHFGAGELKYINRDVIVARNVTFNFQDVPVFWFPFFVQSTKQGRRSGILTPRFGVNDLARTNTGYQRKVENIGLYWAISDYFGAEMALDWQSQNFTSLRGTLDFRDLRKFLAGSLTYRSFWRSEGGRDFTLATRSDWQPDERTRLTGDVSYATSTRFIRQRSIDPRELNQSIRSNVGLNRRFGWGTLNLSGSREQFITDNTVNMTLPSASLNLSSITLFPAAPGETKWFNNATWTANASSSYRTKSIADDNLNTSARGRNEFSSSMSSSFTMGKFGWSQNLQLTNTVDAERLFPNDTALQTLPKRELRKMLWSTGLNFQQRLIGTTTFTPGLSLRGEMMEGDTTGGERVAAPTRLDFNATLRTDLFGFLPGLGPLERIRHRLSPSFTYAYSPEPVVTDRQREVFGALNIREQNRISIGLNQTFEGKPRQTEGQAARDSAAQAAADTASGPRRRPRVQPITILSITTDAVVYDWVQAREGKGVQTTEIGNNIQSDLLRGLQLSFAHDLFEEVRDTVTGDTDREFKPHLSRMSMSFSINADSWIGRLLGLGRRTGEPGGAEQAMAAQDTGRVAPDIRESGQEFGLLGGGRTRSAPRLGAGNWNASINYTMFRPRQGGGGQENQMVTANFSLQPTQQWSLNWSTGYSFTNSEFTDHILTLTRELHDWDANFDFVKAQNGNFSFQFRVQLRANPDIKLDYDQRELRSIEQQQIR